MDIIPSLHCIAIFPHKRGRQNKVKWAGQRLAHSKSERVHCTPEPVGPPLPLSILNMQQFIEMTDYSQEWSQTGAAAAPANYLHSYLRNVKHGWALLQQTEPLKVCDSSWWDPREQRLYSTDGGRGAEENCSHTLQKCSATFWQHTSASQVHLERTQCSF